MSKDISSNTEDTLITTCVKQNIPWVAMGDKYVLGASVGKAYRVAVTVNDEGMAKAIVEALKGLGEDEITMGVVEWPK